MPIDMDDAMRSGAISAKAAKKHWPGVKGPRPVPSTHMAKKAKDEGEIGNKGVVPKTAINARNLQHTGSGMPTKRGAGISEYTPGRKAIDQFPQKQREKFPPESMVRGRPGQGRPNPRSVGQRPASSGGAGGGNANDKEYYGGPMPRAREQ